jgi:hypothetical protein
MQYEPPHFEILAVSPLAVRQLPSISAAMAGVAIRAVAASAAKKVFFMVSSRNI